MKRIVLVMVCSLFSLSGFAAPMKSSASIGKPTIDQVQVDCSEKNGNALADYTAAKREKPKKVAAPTAVASSVRK